MKQSPKHTHDCDSCTYLGSLRSHTNGNNVIDCYICLNENPNMSSIIGRFSNEGSDYASSPLMMAKADTDYLYMADRWFLFGLLIASQRGLIKLPIE